MPTAQHILDADAVNRKLDRMAWEITERHWGESDLVVVGLAQSGYKLAEHLANRVRLRSSMSVELVELSVNKRNPHAGPTVCSLPVEELSNRCVVLVDDVLNSGATLIYGVQHLLRAPLKRLTTAVLVDRNHKSFPIKADIKGLSLSTSLKDHVDVHFHDTGAITVSLRD